MTTIKVRVPFGVSSSKFEEKQLAYEGPDFYNKEKEWIKPSFNIKGRLQWFTVFSSFANFDIDNDYFLIKVLKKKQ